MKIHTVELEALRVAICQAMSRRDIAIGRMDLRQWDEMVADRMVYEMSLYLTAKREHKTESKSVITCPNGLWNYFKQRFFPKWLLAKYPVQLSKFEYIHKTEIVRVCPHIQVPPDRTKFCIQYLEGNAFQ